MMFDKELATWSLIKLQMENDIRILTDEERDNLLELIDDYIISQGWNLSEFIKEK